MTSEDLLREARDPSTTAARLQELAQLDQATWTAIAAHPLAYDGLLDWLGQHGDDSVRAAILARSGTSPLVARDIEPTIEISTDVEPTAVIPVTEPAHTAAPSYGSVGAAPVPEAAAEAPNSTTRSPFVLAALSGAVLAVLIGGYFGVSALTGDDDDDPASAISSQTNPTEEPTDEPPTDESTGDSSKADDDFCTIMKEIQQSSLDSFDPTESEAPDLDALKDTFDDMADAYGELEASAPDNLKADVARMGTYVDIIANPTAESAQKLTTGIDDYIASTQRVTEYYATTCNP